MVCREQRFAEFKRKFHGIGDDEARSTLRRILDVIIDAHRI